MSCYNFLFFHPLDSGRLFVWGENQFGQLGIGGSSNSNSKKNGNTSNSNENIEIVTKPTCVKSLKTLGLKINDAAFGIGWCVILTSNLLFIHFFLQLFCFQHKYNENKY